MSMTSSEQRIKILGCPQCGTTMTTTLISYHIEDKDLGIYPGFVCENGHRYLDGESEPLIKEQAQEKGVWDKIE